MSDRERCAAGSAESSDGMVGADGSGTVGSADGVGGAAQFCNPRGVAISTDGSALLVCTSDSLCQVCVSAPPPPPSFAPIVVPPSTFFADMKKMRGDASLPDGKVTFVVGMERQRFEAQQQANLAEVKSS